MKIYPKSIALGILGAILIFPVLAIIGRLFGWLLIKTDKLLDWIGLP